MLDNLRGKLAGAISPDRPRKAEVLTPFQVLSTSSANIPVYGDMSVRKATREGYKISIFVYRSVRVIIQAASGIPWVVLDKNGEVIPNHPFSETWAHPNSQFSGQDNMEFLIGHLLLAGNSLIQPVMVGGKPKEFWVVMPDLVRPIPSDKPGEWLAGWQVVSINSSKTVPPDQFIHFMQVDPGNPYWGIGPLLAAARTIDTDNEAQDTQKISMQNRAVPDGVFTHEAVMLPEQFEEARRQVRENFLEKSRKREPWILGAGAKWNQMTMSPVEMDFIASRIQNKRDIAGAFGISPIFLGDLEQSSYNNMMEARKALYQDVVIPLLDDIQSTLNLRLARLYGDNIRIAYDVSNVSALREDYSKKVEQAKGLWGMGVPFDQINSRLELGFDEFSGWDVAYIPMALLPVGSTPPNQQEAPSEDEPAPEPEKSYKAVNLRTEEQKSIHWKRADRRRVAWWGVAQKKFLPLYEAEAKAVEEAIKKERDPADMLEAADKAIKAMIPEWERVMTTVLSVMVEDFGNEAAEDIEPKSLSPLEKKDFDPYTEASREWIRKYSAEEISTITTTNIKDVRKVLMAGAEDNLSNPQIAKNLRKFYADQSPYKAMRVARTETCKASTFGNLEAARQSKVVKSKTWLTSRDERVRDEHRDMDGETVQLRENFSNGKDGPSEPMCRCVLTFGTIEVKPKPKPEIPKDIPDDLIFKVGDINQTVVDDVQIMYGKMPPLSRKDLERIILREEVGPTETIGGYTFQIKGEYNSLAKTMTYFDARNISQSEIMRIMSHEAGHGNFGLIYDSGGLRSLRPAYNAAYRSEGGVSSYARSAMKHDKYVGQNENFAECHRIFSQGGGELAKMKKLFPKTYKEYKAIWENDLSNPDFWKDWAEQEGR